MQPRRAAFTIFRRLATQSPKPLFQAPLIRNRFQPLHYYATPTLRAPQRNGDLAAAAQIPEAQRKPHAPRPRDENRPEYEMTFTCKPCGERSTHRITKQGYHHGSVLITCPRCRNRHIISDHLGIFLDKKMTIEDLMKERGQLIKKGSLSSDGDLEFWEDGSRTKRK